MTTRRSVLITGGAQRMGAAQARALAGGGWDVAIHCHASCRVATALAQDLAAEFGVQVVTVAANLSRVEEVDRLVPTCQEALQGALTALVNNASTFEYDQVHDFDVERLETTLRINLIAPLMLARALARQGGRAVVNILDQKVESLNPDFFSYTVSKQALAAATRLLARALAPVRVCGVAPGLSLPSGDQTDAEFSAAHGRAPLGRGSTPADIASAVRFLLEADAVTGQILLVDGGQHMLALERDVMFVERAADGSGKGDR